jgi:hypothetical protein
VTTFRILAVAALLPLFGCPAATDDSGGMLGGECTYTETHGTCSFVDAVGGADVTFDFVSDDGATTDTYTLYVGDGGAPPTQACLDELGVAAGVEVGCTQGTIDEGTCSPAVYTFDDFDTNDCLD